MRHCLIILLLLGALPVLAQQNMRVLRLNFADATVLASYFGGADLAAPEDTAEVFARETVALAMRRMPAVEGQWLSNSMARSYPGGSMGGALQPPAGLSAPPTAIPAQNALVLRGTTDALDRMEEIIAMLDRPQRMVNIELMLLDEPEEVVEQWGVDFRSFGGDVGVGSVGNAPGAGAFLRYGLGATDLLAGYDRRRTRGRNVTGANVTTFDNNPATISFGEILPFFVSHVSYDWWGNRRVDTEPYSIFTGIELFVHPRITGNDTVTMLIRPTIVEAIGAVTSPDGSTIPITKNIGTETRVRVADGQPLVIGGFSQMRDSTTDRFASLLGETTVKRSSHPVLIVTPHIIRE
jgi:type II secretory pathway component GspD/PulD (secretin)